jgi:hypothetical protein
MVMHPTPRLTPIIRYLDGQTIYLSDIHPVVDDERDLQRANIDVVVALLEEHEPPTDVYKHFPGYIRNHHFRVEERVYRLFSGTSRIIHSALERGKNVLVYCRTGSSYCVTILIAFFLRMAVQDARYLIFDFFNLIPKREPTWTWSFLRHIEAMYPRASPPREHIRQLHELEQDLIFDS